MIAAVFKRKSPPTGNSNISMSERGTEDPAEDDGLNDNPNEGNDEKKRVVVKDYGSEKSISLLLVVEEFRLAFYLSFVVINIVAYILTKAFVKGEYWKLIKDVFGTISICVYYDHPPVTYVLPSLWSISLIFIYMYAVASIFRAWVSREEGKLSRSCFILYLVLMCYIMISFIVFTTCFAVQPDPKVPNRMIVHTIPYTNLTVALFALAILVKWFGEHVAWVNLGIPKILIYVNRMMIVFQVISTATKIFQHINCLADMKNGLFYNQHTNKTAASAFQGLDYVFFASVVIWPALQSAYLVHKKQKTHCVYLILEDNRPAVIKEEHGLLKTSE